MWHGIKKSLFSANILLYIRNTTRQNIVTMEGKYDTISKLSNGTSFNDLK